MSKRILRAGFIKSQLIKISRVTGSTSIQILNDTKIGLKPEPIKDAPKKALPNTVKTWTFSLPPVTVVNTALIRPHGPALAYS